MASTVTVPMVTGAVGFLQPTSSAARKASLQARFMARPFYADVVIEPVANSRAIISHLPVCVKNSLHPLNIKRTQATSIAACVRFCREAGT